MTAQITAAVWLCVTEGRVLAVRASGQDVWYLPGGLPDEGETLQEAVAREVLEETGVRLKAASIVESVRVTAKAHGRVDTTVHLICFDAIGDGLASPQPPEISEVAWLEPDDWHTFAPAVQEALARSPLTSLDNY